MTKRRFLSGVVVAALGLMAFTPGGAQAAWKPDKEVTFICPYAPGGGTDVIARILAKIINENNLSPTPWVVINRTGGAGLVAMKYMIDRKGDRNTVTMVTSTTVVASLLEGNDSTSFRMLTPLANLVLEPQFLATHKDSQFKDLKSVLDYAKANPGKLRVAGATIASEDSLSNLMMEKYVGIKTKYVSFQGGGDARKTLMGGHVDVAWLNPNEMEGLMVKDGGNIVPLGVALEQRFPGYDVPTFVELGYRVVFDSFLRGVLGTPGLDPEAVAFYDEAIGKAANSPEFQDALKKSLTPGLYLNAKDFAINLKKWDAALSELIPLVKAIQE